MAAKKRAFIYRQALPPKLGPVPVALSTADWHLTERPPTFRAAEPDWLDAQLRAMNQISTRATKLEVPILHAGDLFDKSSISSRLVNWAIRHCPVLYGVPGNHELPYGNWSDVRHSPWWTLVEAKKIIPLSPGKPMILGFGSPIRVHGFPYGVPVTPPKQTHDLEMDVAIVHSYLWTASTGFPGALACHRLKNVLKKQLAKYDVAIYGDNHKAFDYNSKKDKPKVCSVCNCGGLMRRSTDQVDFRPSYGVIYSDGTIKREYLDISQDRTGEPDNNIRGTLDPRLFMESLAQLGESAIDFREAVYQVLQDTTVRDVVRERVLGAMERQDGHH